MTTNNRFSAAHMGSVNSVFLSIEAGIVIGLEDDSIKIWDPVNGMEVHVYDRQEGEDAVIPGLGAIYRLV